MLSLIGVPDLKLCASERQLEPLVDYSLYSRAAKHYISVAQMGALFISACKIEKMPKMPQERAVSSNAPKVGFVSLGCAKALVDSERILTRLRSEGYAISPSYDGADVVVVNTCGFLDSAKAESLEAIGEAMAENGRVIVTGCFGVEDKRIREAFPDVLAVTGPHQYDAVMSAIHAATPPPHAPFLDLVPRAGLRLTPPHYAYLKIFGGLQQPLLLLHHPGLARPAREPAGRRCACRGRGACLRRRERTARHQPGHERLWSRPEICGERMARRPGEGVAYGALRIAIAARRVGTVALRLPLPHVDELLPLMAEGKILPYLDIPFQHASPKVLKAMRRPANHEKTLDRIKSWRAVCLDLGLRSTFIVGFPGETEEDFAFLLDWLREARLTRVGCFKYENVEGAASRDLDGHVPEEVKAERFERFMAVQRDVSEEVLAAQVGKTVEVLIDEVDEDGATGRSVWDAPDIDGSVFIEEAEDLQPGDRVRATIINSDDYDLWAEILPPA